MWSHREEGPGHCSICEKLYSVPFSTYDIWIEPDVKKEAVNRAILFLPSEPKLIGHVKTVFFSRIEMAFAEY